MYDEMDVMPSSPVSELVERLRSQATLPVYPFDRRSPDYWTSGENGAPCTVCGGTEDGPDKCTGADLRVMHEAADRLTALEAENAKLRDERDSLLNGHRILNVSCARLQDRAETAEAQRDEALKALEPFAKFCAFIDKREAEMGRASTDDKVIYQAEYILLTVGHFRAARAALGSGEVSDAR